VNPELIPQTPPATAPGDRPPLEPVALVFVDAESAAKWADSLPFATTGQAWEGLVGQLRAVTAAAFSARERATIGEVLREPVRHLHTELARRYAGKPQPAVGRESEAADQAIALWQAFWELYSSCLKPLLEGDADLAGVKAKLLQRGLHVGKELVLVYGLARRVPPPALWQELHAYYRLAEMLDCTVTAVSDDATPEAVGISCYSTYMHSLLLALADPYAMSVRQIELADRWLGQWARKVFPYAQQRETEGPVIVVDLEGTTPGTLVASAPSDAPASMRFGYPGKLATSVRGRLKRLAQGASPAELALGHDPSAEQCIALLSHLDARWYQAQRRDESTHAAIDLCGGGVPGAYFRVLGRTFDRQDPLGRLSYANSQHLATLGALTDYDRHKEDAEKRLPWERLEGRYGWREARVTRTAPSQHRWFLDQLVAVRDDERTRLGTVSRVSIGLEGELDVALKLWPGAPKTRAMRPFTTAFSEDPPLPSILLGETQEEAASLVLPPRTFNPGRTLRSMDAGPERTFKLTRLLQRGADFERCAFEES
jgi:cyclic-di-GMP-binding protein